MDVGQLILTLVGTLIGGFVVIVTNWISARRTRTESVQDWHKQTYITDGVDQLITFFVGVQVRWNWNEQELMSLSEVPVAALAKVQILLESDVLTQLAMFIQNYLAGTQIDEDTQVMLLEIGQTLLDLRNELLERIASQVREKNYRLTLPEFRQKFHVILTNLHSQYVARQGIEK